MFYGVLDVLAKPVFGALLLWGHRGIDPKRLGILIRDWDDPIVAHHGEKNGAVMGERGGVSDANGSRATTSGADVPAPAAPGV